VEFIEKREGRRLRVLEINEADNLMQFLSELPKHTIARHPEISMTYLLHGNAWRLYHLCFLGIAIAITTQSHLLGHAGTKVLLGIEGTF